MVTQVNTAALVHLTKPSPESTSVQNPATGHDVLSERSFTPSITAPRFLGRGLDFLHSSDSRQLGSVCLDLYSTHGGFELLVKAPGQESQVFSIGSEMDNSNSVRLSGGQTLSIVGKGHSLILTLDEIPDQSAGFRALVQRFLPGTQVGQQDFVSYTALGGPEGEISILQGRVGERRSGPAERVSATRKEVDVEL
jgi:hypothetical protein